MFFSASVGLGREPAVSDGSLEGTQVLGDLFPGPGSSGGIEFLAAINTPTRGTSGFSDAVVFTANDGVNNYQLWSTDGTESGTSLLSIINPAGSASIVAGDLLNGHYYFRANDGTSDDELWRTDGTSGGTTQVVDLNPAGDGVNFGPIALGGLLLFNGGDGSLGSELWQSDGTAGGTTLVRDINPVGSSYPVSFTPVADEFYFEVDGATSEEIWRTDGTTAGTVLVSAVDGANSYTAGDGVLYFVNGTGADVKKYGEQMPAVRSSWWISIRALTDQTQTSWEP